MKIDKIIFSSSEEYSGFWNVQSKVWKEHLGIEPVCILYGKKENTNMHEKYGKVIERDFKKDLPKHLQITWSKFDHTKTEPETTWIIGDLDLIPLSKNYFTENIKDHDEDSYLHLNFGGLSITRRGYPDAFFREGSQTHARERNGGHDRQDGCDLPAHHHVAKGKLFDKIYNLSDPKTLYHIVECNLYGMGPHANEQPLEDVSSDEANRYYWCAEEGYTSYHLWEAWKRGDVRVGGVVYHNLFGRIDFMRPGHWDKENKKYVFDLNRLQAEDQLIDFHCAKPYEDQEEAMYEVLKLAQIL